MGEISTVTPVEIPKEEYKYPLQYIGGRKFLFAMLAITFGFVLVLTGNTTADNFFRFVEIVGGTYIAGNVVSGISDNIK